MLYKITVTILIAAAALYSGHTDTQLEQFCAVHSGPAACQKL